LEFSKQFFQLGSSFYQQALPVPVAKPKLLLWNTALAKDLAISFTGEQDSELLAQYFSGNKVFDSSKPIAQAYSGHQFGHFNPQLGDGRAHLLGELKDSLGNFRDVQLKGSGVTPFSRQGDGRCALGPALREYIMSEAMFALGVPTTRCLAVVATGENVYRERPLAGAVVTRIAASHLRVGTFQYFAARGNTEALKKLIHYAINRHFPELLIKEVSATKAEATASKIEAVEGKSKVDEVSSQQVLDFFSAVLAKQIPLVLSWLRVGFIHGVMNTDNTAISGETIDYGPCAMMNAYNSKTVFSSIDRNSRYAFGKQISIMQWNMTRLAETLLPLVDSDEDAAVAQLEPLLAQFHVDFEQGYLHMMAAKLGIAEPEFGDEKLINDLVAIMQINHLDYTKTFALLTALLKNDAIEEPVLVDLSEWIATWQARVAGFEPAAKVLMENNNPVVIPRNHHVEALLAAFQEPDGLSNTLNLEMLNDFLAVLRQPYTLLSKTENYQDEPVDNDENYHTFCGT